MGFNSYFHSQIEWNSNIITYTEDEILIYVFSTKGKHLSFYSILSGLIMTHSFKHLDYTYLCTINAFQDVYIINIIRFTIMKKFKLLRFIIMVKLHYYFF